MRYLPHSDAERRAMLDACGLKSLDDLYAHLPAEALFPRNLDIPAGKSEYEISDYFKQQAAKNANGYASFLGAGVYAHYRPVLCDVVVSRGEFLTSYTPYQAEIAQGTLTTIFEFQTMVCQLTGMEVANASMYDGSTAVPEAAMMAARVTGRHKFLVAANLHPEYREVLDTAARNAQLHVEPFGYDPKTGSIDVAGLESKLDKDIACVILQSPNFFGIVENIKQASELAHKHGALLVVVFSEAVSLGLVEPPRDADIVVGELQSFAISPSYGGPFAGIIATKEKYMRQIPGRLVGETKDADGNRAFCLTLSTREQHIRREKATSNICTNQALIALMATVFMSVYGKQGLRELAEQNLAKAHYLAKGLELPFSGPFFNEFVVQPKGRTPEEANAALLEKKIIGGLPLGRFFPELKDSMLLCATEMSKRADIDAVKEVLL
ncbi:aminomethyl-transferring glycine dehydrogenase subunit GcvPA [Paludibaculum fermentans]|uniref:Probable glycine dehydrogenase (decarboxylating) subunit 1 n=1 Tax=Paludibaculum fermentans TaxID=1473598 RepID=A0A7S7NKD3_PALFE|nr:aminomethyl-transferring glycine dehydrogenase subunit GcvPA [Paludibaculum fermentans]QOY85241.1 aminomethyl-transferring glycine dehydrogenase subunit GcvPA [Paludibaculum fermentans]